VGREEKKGKIIKKELGSEEKKQNHMKRMQNKKE